MSVLFFLLDFAHSSLWWSFSYLHLTPQGFCPDIDLIMTVWCSAQSNITSYTDSATEPSFTWGGEAHHLPTSNHIPIYSLFLWNLCSPLTRLDPNSWLPLFFSKVHQASNLSTAHCFEFLFPFWSIEAYILFISLLLYFRF